MNKVGRNDPCPCGSGRKFKHCCGSSLARPASPVASTAAVAPHVAALVREGNELLAQGSSGEAASRFREAAELGPAVPETWACLGNAFDAMGQYDEAVAAYRRALSIRPTFAQVHNNLGLSLQANGHHAAAQRSYRQALSIQPDYAAALYRQASMLDPVLVAARSRLAGTLERLVPAWHVPMMNDDARNEAYYRGLRSSVGPASTVFEIGTGSGLLSMMAARLGAQQVVTCEAEPVIATAAQHIISRNSLDRRIKLLTKRSTEVELGTDLMRPADILVSEIFSSELLGERVLPSIEDAKRRLLRPGGRVIPAVGSIMVALFAGDDVGLNLRVDQVMGFDLSGFNEIVPQRQVIARTDLSIDMLSEEVEAFRFDFERDDAWPAQQKMLRLPVRSAGRCLGLIQWLFLRMDGDTVFENHPAVKAPASGWTRCVYLLPTPVEVQPAQTVIVEATHNRICPWFIVRGVE